MNAHEKLIELLKKEQEDSGMTWEEWEEHMRYILALAVKGSEG